MNQMHSILTIHSNLLTGESCIVVCETRADEKDMLRLAANKGHKVLNVIPTDDACPITLNDYQL